MPDTVVVKDEPSADQAHASAAAAAAQQASDAAANAAAMAEVQSAKVTNAAAGEIAAYEERLRQCETGLSNAIKRQDELFATTAADREATARSLNEATTALSSIQEALRPKEPQPLTNPENGRNDQTEKAAPGSQSGGEGAPRKKAHRWI